MNWKVVVLPEFYSDLEEAGDWYEQKLQGLGARFADELMEVWSDLAVNPLLGCKKTSQHKYPLAISGKIPLQGRLLCRRRDKTVVVIALIQGCKA